MRNRIEENAIDYMEMIKTLRTSDDSINENTIIVISIAKGIIDSNVPIFCKMYQNIVKIMIMFEYPHHLQFIKLVYQEKNLTSVYILSCSYNKTIHSTR